MEERHSLVTVKGNPLTLMGKELKVGDTAPGVELLNNDLQPVNLSDYSGQICVVSSVPSLDTPVCDMETRRFNQEAESLGSDINILTVSMDLPFAQKRWCGAAGVNRVITLSDHRNASFGTEFGVLIKELRLLARAVFIIDGEGIIRYIQLVQELSQEPDYEAVLSALKEMI